MNKRREEILSEIENCKVLCDVGCDHGYVGFECLKRGLAKHVVFSDISAPSLEKAKALVGKSEFEQNASFCVANGLEGVDVSELDSCVIAGMGGEEIMKILAVSAPATCVLQPMSEVEKLREFLMRDFKITVDRLFYDRDKYYNLIVAKKSGGEALSEFEILLGKSNLEKPSEDFLVYAKSRLARQKKIKVNRKDKSENDDKMINFLQDFLQKHE